jgi:hypothetical protein
VGARGRRFEMIFTEQPVHLQKVHDPESGAVSHRAGADIGPVGAMCVTEINTR